MSIAAMNWAYGQAIQGPAKPVLVVLSDHADQDGWSWPGLARIAFRAGFKVRAVQTALRWLEAHGWIKIETNAGGRHRGNRYQVMFSEADRVAPNGADAEPGRAQEMYRRAPTGAPHAPLATMATGAPDAPSPPVRGAPDAPEGCTTCTQTLTEPPKKNEPPRWRTRTRARPHREMLSTHEQIRRDWNLGTFLAERYDEHGEVIPEPDPWQIAEYLSAAQCGTST